jgi:5,10-methylenetetrahydromethanopterin reductase
MTQLGYATGYDPRQSVRHMARWMAEADERGFKMGFFSETIDLMRDSVTALSTFVHSTKQMNIGCTQIVRLRSPLVMAQTIASLDELSEGRIILAPGSCTRTHAIRHGLEPIDPLLTLREWIDAIRLILTGDKVDYDGKVVKFTNVQLGWTPARTHVPMYIAATSRKGLEVAGRIGDGVLLNAVCSPEYSANALKIVRESAEASGRDWSEFRVAQLINCSIDDDRQKALDDIRWEVASKLSPTQIDFIVKPKVNVGEPYISVDDIPMFREAWEQGGKEGLIRAVPDSYIEGMTATGTPDEVLAKIERFREAGVELPILRPATDHQTVRLLDLAAATPVAAPSVA